MARRLDLGHNEAASPSSPPPLYSLPGIVLESVGPVRHEVSVPFHDSQVKGHAVLIQTGWDSRWGSDAYWDPGPRLSDDVMFRLVRSGVRLVGVDFWVENIKETGDTSSATTRLVLTGKIPLIENLRDLAALPRWGFRFGASPLQAVIGPLCPVQVFAEIKS